MDQEIKAYSYKGIQDLFKEMGQPAFRAKQLMQWLYQKGSTSYDDMTNMPKTLRDRLAEQAPLYAAEVVDKQTSKDGTRKYVIRYHDGEATEMVAIPSKDRLTVCFSTQVGCAMACAFCATGQEGFKRNLLPGEMLEQVHIAQHDMGMRVTNLVGMGQGEPFLNYDNVIAALHLFNNGDGMGIGARHITLSTCGILPGISRFAQEPEQFTLAISLHSAIQSTRDTIMPKVKNQPLDQLKRAVEAYSAATSRRVTFEYLLLNGLNDDQKHIEALIAYCKGLLCHVNLIPCNTVPGSPFQASNPHKVQWFLKGLQSKGIEATLRDSRGKDIAGACGQLKNQLSHI